MKKKNAAIFVVAVVAIILGMVMLIPRLMPNENSAYRNTNSDSSAWNTSDTAPGTINTPNATSYDLNPSSQHSGAENNLEPYNSRQNAANQQIGTSSTSRTSE